MAIFTLEALQAKHGDCLILHYGDSDNPTFIVIDGGPGGIYRNFLKKRLLKIREKFTPNEQFPISLLMVSHMDDDHVKGVLDLTAELREAKEEQENPDFNINNMWFNSFDDIIGNNQVFQPSALPSSASAADISAISSQFANLDHHLGAVISSTGQGRRLRDDSDLLGITVNSPFTSPVQGKNPLVRGGVNDSQVDWGNGLEIHVIHPNEERLKKMQKKWDKDLKEAKEKGDDSIIFSSLGDKDTSPFNLASIVCLMKFEGKTILLTGDARDDDILEGLRDANLMDNNDHIHVNILKIPHHGSDRNMSTNFLRHVTADHYIISGNGKHDNPDIPTLEMMSTATRGGDDNFDIHLTNQDGEHDLKKKLDEFIDKDRNLGRSYGFEFRKAADLLLKVDLLDEVKY